MRTILLKAAAVLAAGVLVCMFATPVAVHAAATIVIQNNDGAGEGFNDATPFTPVGGNNAITLGQARLNAFTYAAELWGECINSAVTINIRAQMDPQNCTPTSATLGSASAVTVHRDFANAPVANTWYSAALANSLAGVDLDATQPDINATFNSSINGNPGCLGGGSWYYGLDGNPGPNQWDFVTVVMHEIGHGLGVQTFVDLATGARFMDRNDTFLRFMEQAGAAPSLYTAMNNAQRAAGNISDPSLRWTGGIANGQHPNVPITAGLNGGLLRLHAPNPAQPGSSLSHWSTALTPDELMEPSYTAPDHNMSLALYLLEDTGWSIDDDPPVLTCPGDVEVECTETGGTPASNAAIQTFLAGVSAVGGCGEVVITHDAPNFFPEGETTVTFTATDGAINTVTCSAKVTIVDTTDPVITNCPVDITVECTEDCGATDVATWLAGFTATDVCNGLTLTNDAPACFPLGPTLVTFTATDDANNSSECTATVTVEDTTPPDITVVLSRDVLWPPNHKLVEVCATTVEVTDVCDDAPTFVLLSVTSDEPDNDKGDGNTINDIQNADLNTDDLCVSLRSERQGGGDGRKYTIVYRASDASGNTADAVVCVRVPHDQSAAALASTGFTADGRGFESGNEGFAIILPSTATLYTAGIDMRSVYLGNTAGVVRPVEKRVVDINHDGLHDVALFFPAMNASTVDVGTAGDADFDGAVDRGLVGDGPLGVHIVSMTGVDYLVGNIFALGDAVPMPLWSLVDPPAPLGQKAPEVLPLTTTVTSVHPNPFNPTTTVEFALAGAERVRIAVYDVNGALVRRLLDQAMPVGEHSVVWDGRDDAGRGAASGVYFVRMVAGRVDMARKIVMLK